MVDVDRVITKDCLIPPYAVPTGCTIMVPTTAQVYNYSEMLSKLSPERRALSVHQMIWIWPRLASDAAERLHDMGREEVRAKRRAQIISDNVARNLRRRTSITDAPSIMEVPEAYRRVARLGVPKR